MGKLFVLFIFSLGLCGITFHFFPATAGHAFSVGSVGISWMFLLLVGYMYAGHKLSSK